jgi:uncharacterized protein (DUF1697 family)
LEKIVYSDYCIWINVVQKFESNKLKSLMKSQISTYEQNNLIGESLMKISWKKLEKIVYSEYCIWINVVQKLKSNKLKSLMKSQISTYEQNNLIGKSLMKISGKSL